MAYYARLQYVLYAKGIEYLCVEASEGGEKKMRYENDHDRKFTYSLDAENRVFTAGIPWVEMFA